MDGEIVSHGDRVQSNRKPFRLAVGNFPTNPKEKVLPDFLGVTDISSDITEDFKRIIYTWASGTEFWIYQKDVERFSTKLDKQRRFCLLIVNKVLLTQKLSR